MNPELPSPVDTDLSADPAPDNAVPDTDANPSPPERADLDLEVGDQTDTPANAAVLGESESQEANTLPFGEDKDIIPVVGLGGSAGSVGPLQEFFGAMKPDTGMAFVVVLHLAPDYESVLPQIIQARTSMTVVQVTEMVPIKANHVYVIPPAKYLSMQDGHIQLSDPDRPRGRHVAVDLFFRTLAAARRSRAVAVVLSGTDSDGAIGIKRIKEHGGVTVAQDPSEAEYDGMPRAAIGTGMVDWVLPIGQLAPKLAEFAVNEERIKLPDSDAESLSPTEPPEETALREVLAFLLARTGHDFSHYKRATVLRRIARRLQVNSLDNLPAYVAFLRTHPGEASALLQDLLISVTNFFRDPEAFEELSAHIPDIFAGRRPSETIRVWVPGCATGEEAYSIAMLLFEHVGTLAAPPAIQIFATDIDEEALRTAREGLYPTTIAADVSPERLRRFFVSEQGRYRMKKEVREVVLFASHNILRDSPFSRLDLVSCRNLLIYFNPAAQERVFEVFHFALRGEGLMFLGGAESADDAGVLFRMLDKKHHIFRRRQVSRPTLPMLPVPSYMPAPAGLTTPVPRPRLRQFSEAEESAERAPEAPFTALHLRLLEQLSPPSVLVDDDYNVLHLSESAGRYLRVAAGEMSNSLLAMVPTVLRLELRAALFRAIQNGGAVDVPPTLLSIEGEEHLVGAQVRPFNEGGIRFLLVVFNESGQIAAPIPLPSDQSVASRLEEELEASKRYLRHTVEQYEASTEELKASNEELQAVNEELHAAGEELETSREELQATNEELTTVNQELKAKVEEVSLANSDLRNLMVSTDIATLFLDRQLLIKRFTPRITDLFRLIPADTGRPLADLRHRLQLDEGELEAACDRVLATLLPTEREVRSAEGREYTLRILPYRTQDDRIDGVVLTFMDTTERNRVERALRSSEAKYRTLFTSIDEAFALCEIIVDAKGQPTDYRMLEVNPAFEQMTGIAPPDTTGKTARELVPGIEDWWIETYGKVALNGETFRFENRVAALDRWFDAYASPVSDGGAGRFALVFKDITERKRREASLTLLGQLADDFARFSTEAEILSAIGPKIKDQFHPLSRLAVCLYDEPRDEIVALYDNHAPDFPDLPPTLPLSQFMSGAFLNDLLTGNVVAINDLTRDPRTREQSVEFAAFGARAQLIAPLARDGAVRFVLALQAGEPRAWRADEIDLLQEIAGQLHPRLERARSEAALHRAEDRFRVLVTATSDAVYHMNADWTEMRSLRGRQFLENTEKPERGWLEKYIPSEDRTAVMEAVERAIRTKSAYSLEHRIIRADGSVGWTFSRAIPILDAHDEIVEWYGGATDITAFREAEELVRRTHEDLERLFTERSSDLMRSEARFAGTFRSSPIAMMLTTQEKGRVVDANDAALQFFGLTREAVVERTTSEIGEWRSSAYGTTDTQSTRDVLQEQLRATGLVRDVEVNFTTLDGTTRAVLCSIVTLPNGDENLLLTMLVDTSAQKAAEEGRERLMRRLVTVLEDERRRISRELHDQMGQKLNALMLGLKVLPAAAPEADNEASATSAATERIASLQEITVSLMEDTRRLAWELRPAALDTLGLESALRQHLREWEEVTGLSTDLEAHQLTAETRLRPELETAFYRIAQEALTNIARHAGATRARILLQMSSQHLIMTVEDNGKGFSPAGEEGTDPVGDGERLGLLGMRERAEAIGGMARVESVPNEGTTVYVRAPLEERKRGRGRRG